VRYEVNAVMVEVFAQQWQQLQVPYAYFSWQGAADQKTSRPADQQTSKPADKQTNRLADQKTDAPMLLAAARKQAASKEILLWMTPSEAPKALQASECSELLDPMRASCWISAQH
jgi:hypothetical protein